MKYGSPPRMSKNSLGDCLEVTTRTAAPGTSFCAARAWASACAPGFATRVSVLLLGSTYQLVTSASAFVVAPSSAALKPVSSAAA